MKNNNIILIITIVFSLGLGSSCIDQKKEDKKVTTPKDAVKNQGVTNRDTIRRCHTMNVLEKHLAKTPDLRSRMEKIEEKCQDFIKLRRQGKIKDTDTITIPTIVHVIYSDENDNISTDQIQSQMDVLNKDFSKTNTDIDQIPEEFLTLSADSKIQFELDSIIRVPTTRKTWGTDDQMKFSSNGGSDVIDSSRYLNIWICTIGGGILGYAQFPGDSAATDGIVITPQYFGTEGNVKAPFDKGRTTTHEVGHWLNLRHIWGDGNCSKDDFVADTPFSDTPNYGCPQYPIVHCNSNDMTMNYMDYVDDACMHLFTDGQMERMRAVFTEGGFREGFIKE